MARGINTRVGTNIVAFVPLMFIPGETGKFWKPLPIVVIIVLAITRVPIYLRTTRAEVLEIRERDQRSVFVVELPTPSS